MGIWEALSNFERWLNGIVWGWPGIILLVGTGIYYTIRATGLQFRKFGYIMKNTIGKMFEKKQAGEGAITPFQAVTTALAATVGTGNVAGVAGAIALGGPGAVFWMWVSALFGMLTKYAEVVLAIKYRQRNEKGDWVGGPMYYITNGLGKNWKWLAVIFSVFGCLAAFGIGNMTQINTIASSISSTIADFSGSAGATFMLFDKEILWSNLIIGIVVSAFCALVLIGGLKRIGQVTERLVPFMAVIYIIAALAVVFTHLGNIGTVFKNIFVGAFSFKAAIGGAVGITITETIRRGVSRGVFSNEAGLGSAPIAHAAADTEGPVQQGMYGVFEVFADTIVICTLTALALLMSGTPITYGASAGSELTIAAFAMTFGSKIAGLIVSLGITLFATSTILSWCLYGTRCAEFLLGTKVIKPYQIFFCIIVIVGAILELQVVWDIADTLNGLMALPNLVALLGLSPVVFKLTKEYFGGLKINKTN